MDEINDKLTKREHFMLCLSKDFNLKVVGIYKVFGISRIKHGWMPFQTSERSPLTIQSSEYHSLLRFLIINCEFTFNYYSMIHISACLP